jgi:MFS family permease
MSSSALRNKNFLIYLCGSTISLHGLWIYRVALGWYAWQLSGSELWIGIVAFTQFAPAVVFGPLFGVLADRFDRRMASILINAGSVLNMLVLSTLTFLGQVDITVLAATSLVQGVLDGAHTPVRMTLVPSIVSREQLQSAIASNSIAFNISRFVGPAISGFIIATWGVGTAFAVNSVSYLAIVAAVLMVQVKPAVEKTRPPANVWSELRDGVRYAIAHRTIRALFITVAVASVFGRGALEMMPAFADAVFRGGAAALAILTSAIGVGSVATGLVLSRHTHWLDARVVRVSVVASGMLIVVFGLIDNFWFAVPIVTILGVCLSLAGVGSQILIQSQVDDELRGRVSSLWGMIAFGGTAIGSLIVGSVAAAVGLQITVIVTGLLCTAAAIVGRTSHS